MKLSLAALLLCLMLGPVSPIWAKKQTSGKLDSLLQQLKTEHADTTQINTLIAVSQEYSQKSNFKEANTYAEQARVLAASMNDQQGSGDALNQLGAISIQQGDLKRAMELLQQALHLRQQSGDKKGESATLNNIGNVHYSRGDYKAALENYMEALKIREAIGDKKGISGTLVNIGNIYKYQGNYARALDNYFHALGIKEEIRDKKGIPNLLNNIGTIYSEQNDSRHAMDYYHKALDLSRESGNRKEIGHALNNIGNLCASIKDYPGALENYTKALGIRKEIGDKNGISVCLNNLGMVYLLQGKAEKALDYFNQALDFKKELEDKLGTAITLQYIGSAFLSLKKLPEALRYSEESLDLAHQIGSLEVIRDAEKTISELCDLKKDPGGALKHYQAFVRARDSLFNAESVKRSLRAEMNFSFEKKEAIEKAEQDKKAAINAAENRRQRISLYAVSGILIIVFGFVMFVLVSYRQKQEANRELDRRNRKLESAYRVIETKNQEITDSISYARRIQNSILPKIPDIKKVFPKSLIVYQPKDIVSGDFYFFATKNQNGETGKELFILAAADCTGHGVPGAFMSMIGSEKLHEAIHHDMLPGEMLAQVNRGIRAALRQSSSPTATRDGMDISLCSYDPKDKVLHFAGANRPVWIFRNGSGDPEEIKATKAAIGGLTVDKQIFGTHEVKLNAGDRFYLFTDGYADQFGGEHGKKLTTKAFRELLREIQALPMDMQEIRLSEFAIAWRAGRDQVDDILVIGVEA